MTEPASSDTIAAVATPPGRGGVGIVRVSGPRAASIGRALLRRLPSPREARARPFLDAQGEPLDRGLALWFPGPASFTGEDVLELHGHGGPLVLDMLLARVLELGARMARPGEFSERAFLNGKLDLSQAEAIADLIDASSRAAARGAMRTLEGAFSRRIDALVTALVDLRVLVEGSLDFPDEEDVGAIGAGVLTERLDGLLVGLEEVRAEAAQGSLLRDGASVAIVGAPNVGKSTLLNRLAGRESAIVTAVPGTTRDVVRESLEIAGVPVQLVDTAGLRPSDDPVEAIGIARARRAAEAADLLLAVGDDTGPEAFPPEVEALLGRASGAVTVRNKVDLSGRAAGERSGSEPPCVLVSAETGAGIAALEQAIARVLGVGPAFEGAFTARRRHLDALARARTCLEQARETTVSTAAIELAADDLRLAQQALGEITGTFTSDDLLGAIFSSFCIGK